MSATPFDAPPFELEAPPDTVVSEPYQRMTVEEAIVELAEAQAKIAAQVERMALNHEALVKVAGPLLDDLARTLPQLKAFALLGEQLTGGGGLGLIKGLLG